MKTTLLLLSSLTTPFLAAQPRDIVLDLVGKAERPVIAVPDFRGAAEAQQFMTAFNQTLWNDLDNGGVIKLAPKTMYPLQAPQQPSDFRPGTAADAPKGSRFVDWSGPPVGANYLAFGYTAVKDGKMVLFGWLDNVTLPDPANAQIIGKLYLGSLDVEGAKNVAHQFAADILQQFGGKSMFGSKIYFVSERSGHKEIWSMDYDGSNQKQITSYRSISTFPGVSPDGMKIAFTSYAKGAPQILVHSLETMRILPFYNPDASMNATPDFTPDSKQIVFSSTAAGGPAQIYLANANGGGLHRITTSNSIEIEPKVNPKTGSEIIFNSGRSGLPQIYRMNLDGADVARLSSGAGEAVNPAWNPDGQHIAFAWTKGFDPGNYNIFMMDVATRTVIQLTSGEGRNENPSWAPDGIHIVYSSKRGRSTQIYTMLADGTKQQQLTTQGVNHHPVWGKSIN